MKCSWLTWRSSCESGAEDMNHFDPFGKLVEVQERRRELGDLDMFVFSCVFDECVTSTLII